jgi:hypothetical protein
VSFRSGLELDVGAGRVALSICLAVFDLVKMAFKTTTKAVLYRALAMATGANGLRISSHVSELRNMAAGEDSLQEQYSSVQAAADIAADTDPSLLYPAHTLSVPIDHFHNDSLYEPHVSFSPPHLITAVCRVADSGHPRQMALSI